MSWSRKSAKLDKSIGKGLGGALRGLGRLARWSDRQRRRSSGPSAPPPTISESLAPYRQVRWNPVTMIALVIVGLGLLYAAYIFFFV